MIGSYCQTLRQTHISGIAKLCNRSDGVQHVVHDEMSTHVWMRWRAVWPPRLRAGTRRANAGGGHVPASDWTAQGARGIDGGAPKRDDSCRTLTAAVRCSQANWRAKQRQGSSDEDGGSGTVSLLRAIPSLSLPQIPHCSAWSCGRPSPPSSLCASVARPPATASHPHFPTWALAGTTQQLPRAITRQLGAPASLQASPITSTRSAI